MKHLNSLEPSLVLFAASLFTATSAMAQSMVISFDDATNPFSGGVISTSFASTGSSSLFIDTGVQSNLDLTASYLGQHVQITMDVLDLGKWVDTGTRTQGPRLGVAGGGFTGAETVAFSIYNGNGFAPSNGGYVLNQDAYVVDGGNWWGVDFWTGSTRAALSATPNDGSIATTPVWTQITWDVDVDGAVSLTGTVSPNARIDNIGTTASRILIHGGRDASLGGVYVDNISIAVVAAVPEPQSLAFLFGGLGLLTMFVRRRR